MVLCDAASRTQAPSLDVQVCQSPIDNSTPRKTLEEEGEMSEGASLPSVMEAEGTVDMERSDSSLNQTLQEPELSDGENRMEQQVCEESDVEEADADDFHLFWSCSEHESESTTREKKRSVSTEGVASPFLGDAKSEHSDVVDETLTSSNHLPAVHTHEEMEQSTRLPSPRHQAFFPDIVGVVITPGKPPPTPQELADTCVAVYDLPMVQHQKPFYSKPEDVQTPK